MKIWGDTLSHLYGLKVCFIFLLGTTIPVKIIGMKNMFKLSSTSALVLLWARQDCYRSIRAKDYLGQLDLKEGSSLYEQCREVCPYYDEVIKNRKFAILKLVEKCCSEGNKLKQLVIAGAGLDALGIEVTDLYRQVKVFEIDRENMDLKRGLLSGSRNEPDSRIEFIKADLLAPSSLYKILRDHGWDPDKPTLLILEGISYYIPMETIKRIFQVINPYWTIFEFLKKERDIAHERLEIPEKVFGLISSHCGLPRILRYGHGDLERLFGMPAAEKYSMKSLENMRTGSNRFFLTEDSGWIEVCLLSDQGKAISGG